MRTAESIYQTFKKRAIEAADEKGYIYGSGRGTSYYGNIIDIVKYAKLEGNDSMSSAVLIFERLYNETGIKRVNKYNITLTYENLKNEILEYSKGSKLIRGKGKDFPWHGRLNSFLDTGRDVRFTNIADFYNFLYIDTGIETEYMKNKITYQNLKNIILEYVKDKKEIIGNEYQLPWHRKLNALVDKKENGINSFDDFYNKLFEDTGIKRIKKHKSCDEMYKEIEEEVIKYVDGKKFIKGIQEQLPFHKLMFNLTLKAKKEKNEKYINNQEIYKRIYENTGIVRIKMKRALTLERLAMDIQEAVDNGFPDNKWKRDVVNYAQWHGLTLEEVMHQLGYTDFKSRKPYDFKKKL